MTKRFRQKRLCGALCGGLLLWSALAGFYGAGPAFGQMPTPHSTAMQRFTAADANNDDMLSLKEFQQAFPQLKQAAFDAIDSNRDGEISRTEWEEFTQGHGQKSGGLPAVPPSGGAGAELPLLLPPESPVNGTQAQPPVPAVPQGQKAAPHVLRPGGSLPLLAPPDSAPKSPASEAAEAVFEGRPRQPELLQQIAPPLLKTSPKDLPLLEPSE